MKLYKKGDRKLLSNYRFLHLKYWLSKITEKVIMKRIKTKMGEATSHNQHFNTATVFGGGLRLKVLKYFLS